MSPASQVTVPAPLWSLVLAGGEGTRLHSRTRGEDGVRGISAGMNVSFLAESHWPGQVKLGTGVIAIGTSSITVGSAAFKDGACIVAAEMTVVRLKGKTPHPIDPELRAALEKLRLKGF